MPFFGKNIKKIRSIKSLSQQAFADLFSLKRGTLGAYEEGRSRPKIDTVIKVANYFSISMDSLLKRDLTVNELMHFKTELMDVGLTSMSKVMSGLKEVPFLSIAEITSVKNLGVDAVLQSGVSKVVIPIRVEGVLLAWEIGDGLRFDSAFLNEEIVITVRVNELRTKGYYLVIKEEEISVGFVDEVSGEFEFKDPRLKSFDIGVDVVLYEIVQVIKNMALPVENLKGDVLRRLDRIEKQLNL